MNVAVNESLKEQNP